jgi:hydrogenase maturation protein HypF
MEPSSAASLVRVRLRISGLVQGVGFRPFVWRRATDLGLTGWVGNDATGVILEAEGTAASVEGLLEALQSPPPLSRVDAILQRQLPPEGGSGFEIHVSDTAGARRALVSPDTGTCRDCDPAPVRQLHLVRAALHHRDLGSVRPGPYDHGGLPDVPLLPRRVRRPDKPAISRRTGLLPLVRTAAAALLRDRRRRG